MFGLPKKVIFCTNCLLSNQKTVPTAEFKFKKKTKKLSNTIDKKENICNACKFNKFKQNNIDWEKRENELLKLLEKFRSKNGKDHDCIVPGSGGKDSRYTSHILKFKYGMNPLTVTWSPHIYTDIGYLNMKTWSDHIDNYLITPNRSVQRILTKTAFLNLLHPFQPFVFGQRFAAIRIAMQTNIKLIFHGESPFEYGTNDLKSIHASGFNNEYFAGSQDLGKIFLGGVSAKDHLIKNKLKFNDLKMYFPINPIDLKKKKISYKFLGYYLNWNPQEIYYYAVNKTKFLPNPERTEGTYSKYASLDDRIDGFHYYTAFIKYGLGRASMDASQEIRNGQISREEGKNLVRKYDGEFPKKYFEEVLDYMMIDKQTFWKTINKFRPKHLWRKNKKKWRLLHTVYGKSRDY